MVEQIMRRLLHTGLLLFGLATLAACAVQQSTEHETVARSESIRDKLGCAEDQVLACTAVHCRDEDWVCTDRDSMRKVFSPNHTQR